MHIIGNFSEICLNSSISRKWGEIYKQLATQIQNFFSIAGSNAVMSSGFRWDADNDIPETSLLAKVIPTMQKAFRTLELSYE